MEDHEVDVLDALAEQERGAAGHVGERRPVEPVAAHAVLLAPGPRHRVGVRVCRQRVVERGVEDGDLRHVGEPLARHLDALDVGRVVQRRKGFQLLDRRDDVVGDHDRVAEPVAAVDDPMTDRDQAHLVERRAAVAERVGDDGQRLAVRRDGSARRYACRRRSRASPLTRVRRCARHCPWPGRSRSRRRRAGTSARRTRH